MYVDESKSHQHGKTYTRALIRESYRKDGKVKHRTIANISKCSPEEIEAIKLALKHKENIAKFIVEPVEIHVKQGLSVGAIFVLYKVAQEMGIVKALGNTKEARLSLWMALARLIYPGLSRLGTVRLAQRHAAVDVLCLDKFNEDDLYKALDWIDANQQKIEKRMFQNRNPSKKPELFLYDVSSSYLEGTENELADFGYNRDKKKGKMQIVFGLLTDENGWPISIEVFCGNTQDPATFKSQIEKLAHRFGCEHITMVGDRGMIKSGQIKDISEHEFYYITAITKPQINTLMKQGAIQMELFNEQLCEIEYEKIRYILKRNPVRAKELENTRKSKTKKIEELVKDRNQYLDEHPKADVTVAVSTVNSLIAKLKLSDFLSVQVAERTLSLECDVTTLEEATRLDGCYVIKSNVPKNIAEKETIHQRYKDLAFVEDAFRDMKTNHLEIRPVNVRKAPRTRGHVFIVMLSYFISKHLREKWADIDITVEEGIQELSTICSTETCVGTVTYNRIPEPRKLGSQLIKALDITLPHAIPCQGIKVATRKKLNVKRKKC